MVAEAMRNTGIMTIFDFILIVYGIYSITTARKMRQRSDGRTPGRQLLLGDPVPANCRCVICGYCGAENLLPLNSRDRYCCYFCREALEK